MREMAVRTASIILTLLALMAAAACSSGTTTPLDTFEQEEGVDLQTDGTDPVTEDPVREEGMCEPGQVLCGDKCVDTATDPENCGECFHACPFPQNAGATCESGECGWSCIAGWVDVDGVEANGCECRSEGTGESTCDDGQDNDCDGDADCADAECEGVACGEAGMICSGGSCICSLGEPPETDCGDGVDNDCDGNADCRDGDCGGESCGEATDLCCGTDCVDTLSNFYHCGVCYNDCTSGQVCNLGVCGASCGTGLTDCGGSCVDTNINEDHCGACFQPCPSRPNATRTCTGGACGFTCASNFFDLDGDPLNGCECHRTSAAEAACGDMADNDCDGLVDCADGDCNGMSCSATGRICAGGNCLCPGGEVNEATCNDLSDNDCDGLVDCADPDCGGSACGPYGRICSGLVCVCPGGEANELTCSDGLDNDCDGVIDCEDGGCAGRGCGASGNICCALTCVDIQTNNSHCGGCDNPCTPPQACVGGACTTTCTNDCTALSRRCDPGGLNGYQECGQYDLDPCIEWSSTTLCTGTSICYNGQCIAATPPGSVIINEVLYDGPSTTDPQTVFIELWGVPGLDLTGFNLAGINGANGAEYATIDLFGHTMPADGYFVIVHPSADPALAAVADMQSAAADLQNDAESLLLRWGTGSVVDALGYGDSGVYFRGEGNYAPDVSPGHSLSRNRAHWDTNDNRADFHDDATPTPGRNEDPAYSISSIPSNFIDISATGTDTGLTDVDDSYVTVVMGLNFTFFGNVYDTVYVGTNGMVTFNSSYASEYYNQQLPDTWAPNDVVACFWDDLYVRATDAIYTQLTGTAPNRSFIVQYNDLDFWEATPGTYNPATLTFEIILNEDGSIACQYSVMTSTPAPQKASGGSATVGLENADASDYVLHSYNDPSGVFSPGGLLFTPN